MLLRYRLLYGLWSTYSPVSQEIPLKSAVFASCIVKSFRWIFHCEPSLDGLRVQSDVISSVKIISLLCRGIGGRIALFLYDTVLYP